MKPTFSCNLLPIKPKRSNYKCENYIRFSDEEDLKKWYKNYPWNEIAPRDKDKGVYGIVRKADMEMTVPLYNVTVKGYLVYIGMGTINLIVTKNNELRLDTRGLTHNDWIANVLRKNPDKYALYNFTYDIPVQPAQAGESFLIDWEHNTLGFTYTESENPVYGQTWNKRPEKKHLSSANFYLNTNTGLYESC